MDYQHLITVEAGKRGGKPCIRGLRITVYDVLEYLASGMSEDEILADFSELTRRTSKRVWPSPPTVSESSSTPPRETPARGEFV
jgi:uncharacterized protein (DUF433 family)